MGGGGGITRRSTGKQERNSSEQGEMREFGLAADLGTGTLPRTPWDHIWFVDKVTHRNDTQWITMLRITRHNSRYGSLDHCSEAGDEIAIFDWVVCLLHNKGEYGEPHSDEKDPKDEFTASESDNGIFVNQFKNWMTSLIRIEWRVQETSRVHCPIA